MGEYKIPTATGLIHNKFPEHNGIFVLRNIEEFMIEFAKLHVEAALTHVYEKINIEEVQDGIKDSILNAYPLDNIK